MKEFFPSSSRPLTARTGTAHPSILVDQTQLILPIVQTTVVIAAIETAICGSGTIHTAPPPLIAMIPGPAFTLELLKIAETALPTITAMETMVATILPVILADTHAASGRGNHAPWGAAALALHVPMQIHAALQTRLMTAMTPLVI